jgi:hypothetical protein
MEHQVVPVSEERRSSRWNDDGVFVAVANECAVFATAVDVFKRGIFAHIKLQVSQ